MVSPSGGVRAFPVLFTTDRTRELLDRPGSDGTFALPDKGYKDGRLSVRTAAAILTLPYAFSESSFGVVFPRSYRVV